MTSVVLADLAESVGAWSTFALACLGVLAFLGTLLGIYQARRDAKRARTLDYLSRLFSMEFAPLNTRVMTFLKSGESRAFLPGAVFAVPLPKHPPSIPAAKRAYEELDLDQQANLTLVLNFYEELSGSYRAGLLDEEVAENMLAPVLISGWEAAQWFIALRQRAGLQRTRRRRSPQQSDG